MPILKLLNSNPFILEWAGGWV